MTWRCGGSTRPLPTRTARLHRFIKPIRQIAHHHDESHHDCKDHPVLPVEMARPLQQQPWGAYIFPAVPMTTLYVSRRRGSGRSASTRPPANRCVLRHAAGRRSLADQVKHDEQRLLTITGTRNTRSAPAYRTQLVTEKPDCPSAAMFLALFVTKSVRRLWSASVKSPQPALPVGKLTSRPS